METSQLDVAKCGLIKGNAGTEWLRAFWFYCIQCSSQLTCTFSEPCFQWGVGLPCQL